VNPAEFSTVLLYQGLTGLAENAGREMQDLKLRDEFVRQQDNAVCCVWKAKLVNLVTILLKFASNFCDRKHMHSVCSHSDLCLAGFSVLIFIQHAAIYSWRSFHYCSACSQVCLSLSYIVKSCNFTSLILCPAFHVLQACAVGPSSRIFSRLTARGE